MLKVPDDRALRQSQYFVCGQSERREHVTCAVVSRVAA